MEGDTKKQHYHFFSVMKKLAPEAKQARGKKEPKPDNHVLWGVWSKAAIASCKHGPGFSHPCKYPTGCWGLITGFVWGWPQAYLKCVIWQNSELSGLVMEKLIVGGRSSRSCCWLPSALGHFVLCSYRCCWGSLVGDASALLSQTGWWDSGTAASAHSDGFTLYIFSSPAACVPTVRLGRHSSWAYALPRNTCKSCGSCLAFLSFLAGCCTVEASRGAEEISGQNGVSFLVLEDELQIFFLRKKLSFCGLLGCVKAPLK